MTSTQLDVRRLGTYCSPEKSKVLIRPFVPGGTQKIHNILDRITKLSEEDVNRLLEGVLADFGKRHRDFGKVIELHYENIKSFLPRGYAPSLERRLLIGAYFTCEYALESAALFNPSIVPHPHQSEVPKGSLRFILSLRATGEGHISSIEFKTGIVSEVGDITIDQPGLYMSGPGPVVNPAFTKNEIRTKLIERDCFETAAKEILRSLPTTFLLSEMRQRIRAYRKQHRKPTADLKRTLLAIQSIVESNYEIRFCEAQPLSERVLFPSSAGERNGMEDARFVRFVDDDQSVTYYATYTAYDGRQIQPKLLETTDFLSFRVREFSGKAVKNKGMALFPKKLNGKYVMISRQDGENLYLSFSKDVCSWNETRKLLVPTRAWEYLQIGNCGSPIETEKGWLLLTHGVGPLRRYCIGAVLLDRDDPLKVIGQLMNPLIEPDETEREGYVPNVVYTCGALVHNRVLIIPYAISDYATRFATVSIDKLLECFEKKQ